VPTVPLLTDREEIHCDETQEELSYRSVRKGLPLQPIHTKTAADFGATVRKARTTQGLTQRQLALAVGTGERFIVDLENGKETARLGKALAVATALGINLDMTYED
jgi:HTH-type transcriptional regulator / antitoxin HipB